MVPDERPVAPSAYATLVVPEPRLVPPDDGRRVPKVSSHTPGFVVLYLNQPVAAAPFGFAAPFSVPVVVVRLDAAFVVTTGAAGVYAITVAMRPKRAPLVPAE